MAQTKLDESVFPRSAMVIVVALILLIVAALLLLKRELDADKKRQVGDADPGP
jgi:hypothetical protein